MSMNEGGQTRHLILPNCQCSAREFHKMFLPVNHFTGEISCFDILTFVFTL